MRLKRILPLILLAGMATSAQAQETELASQTGSPPASLLPSSDREVVYLWPNGAPGSEGQTGGETYRVLGDRLILSQIHRPSITVYLPPEGMATGASVIVAPGGGFQENWITHEGYRIADWLAARGIAAFVLKYRLGNYPDSPYNTMEHSLADVQRAIRTVRSRASEWAIDPKRIGVMGFSAGGALAGLAGTLYDQPVAKPVDEIDRLSARPAFQGLIYGTPFAPPMNLTAKLPADMPPVFLAAGGDDRIAESYPDIYKMLVRAGVKTELHLWAGVPHGFGIQPTNPPAVAGWTDRFREWLSALGMLQPR